MGTERRDGTPAGVPQDTAKSEDAPNARATPRDGDGAKTEIAVRDQIVPADMLPATRDPQRKTVIPDDCKALQKSSYGNREGAEACGASERWGKNCLPAIRSDTVSPGKERTRRRRAHWSD